MGKRKGRSSSEIGVEKITSDRIHNGIIQYKVKWIGKSEETWEDAHKLDCEEEIQRYDESKEDSGEDGNGVEAPPKKMKVKEEKEEGEEEFQEEEEDEDQEDDPDEEFEVDCLVGDRVADDGKTQYKVRWRGYESDQDTWENESNLGCPEIIEEYNANKGAKGSKKGKGRAPGNKAKVTRSKKSIPVGEREPDKIVGLHTLKNGKRELLVRWKNLPESEDSWEPEDSMLNTPVHEKFLIKEKENKAKKEAKLKELAPEE